MNYGGIVLILIGVVMIVIGWRGTNNAIVGTFTSRSGQAPSS